MWSQKCGHKLKLMTDYQTSQQNVVTDNVFRCFRRFYERNFEIAIFAILKTDDLSPHKITPKTL